MTELRRSFRRWLPWLVGAGVFGWLLTTTDLNAAGRALAQSDTGGFIAIVCSAAVVLFAADTATWVLLFQRQREPVPALEVARVKAVSYIVDAINHAVAGVAAAYVLSNLRGGPFVRWLGFIVWGLAVDVIALLALLTVGNVVPGAVLAPEVASALGPLVGVGWAGVALALIYWHAGWDAFVLGRLREWRIFNGFARARLKDVALVTLARMGFLVGFALFEWLVLPTFHIHVNFATVLVLSPLVALAQSIPGTMSGLGTAQPLLVALYLPYVDPSITDPTAQAFAFTTAFGLGWTLARLLLGYAFLGPVARDMVPRRSALRATQATRNPSLDPPPPRC